MGTRFELVLDGRDPVRAKTAGEAAMAILEECHARLSRFESDSIVSRINREANESWVRVDSETFELLARCGELEGETDGAFNVCVGVPMDRVRAARSERETSACGTAGAFELDARSSSVRFTRPG